MSKTPFNVLLLCFGLVTASCAGKTPMAAVSFAPKTTLTSPAGRCPGGKCACRPLEAGFNKEKGIPAGHKRFEFRLPRSTAALWVAVDDRGVYYKPPTQVRPECFYVDLVAGKHQIVVHGEKGHDQVPLQSGLTIYEYGEPQEGGPSWYRSFHFTCGLGASPCTKDEIEIWRTFQRKLPRGVLDPCGSVRVKAGRFAGTRDQKGDEVYRDMTLRFTLNVYKFKPHRPPGSPKCKAPSKNR